MVINSITYNLASVHEAISLRDGNIQLLLDGLLVQGVDQQTPRKQNLPEIDAQRAAINRALVENKKNPAWNVSLG